MWKKKKTLKVALFMIVLLLCHNAVLLTSAADENIRPSSVEYTVHMNEAQCVFISNDKPIDFKVGDKYFLTYTISHMQENSMEQSGFVITTDKEETYPYTKGGLIYEKANLLCDEGYTYFVRFEMTEEGMKVIPGKAKDDESEYLTFPYVYGDIKAGGSYFGVWFAEVGKVTGQLTHVRCYDEDGNDLGVYANSSQGVVALSAGEMQENTKIEHTYSFSLSEASCIAISNAKYSLSDTIFLEYTIQNVKAAGVNQNGVIVTSSPAAMYPHGDGAGYMKYQTYEEQADSMLIEEGAHYLLRFKTTAKDYDILIKRTSANGAIAYFSFPVSFGTYSASSGYRSVWIGEGCKLTADFTDVKAYDSEGNNLAIQTNQGVKVFHHGNLEDYSQCEAVYYCKQNDTFITLDDECNAGKYIDGNEYSEKGTYFIRATTLSMNLGGETEEYDYIYNSLTDKEGNTYIRLKDTMVKFVSESIGGEELATVEVTGETGYKVQRPSDPETSNRKFQTWVNGDGKEYDFDEVVMESMTLYASWDKEGDYLLTGIQNVANTKVLVVLSISGLLVIGTVIVVVRMIRGEKHGGNKK